MFWSGLPFPSPVDHFLSDLSTMTRPSWVAPWAWLSFIELDKGVVLVWLDWLVFCSMVSVCLPSDTLLQHLPSYLGFSYLGHGVSLHGCSSKARLLLLTLDEEYLLTAALPDLQHVKRRQAKSKGEKTNIYQSIVDLQCTVKFSCTAKWGDTPRPR